MIPIGFMMSVLDALHRSGVKEIDPNPIALCKLLAQQNKECQFLGSELYSYIEQGEQSWQKSSVGE